MYKLYLKYGFKEKEKALEQGTNILLSLMQLDIGGAETHVVELAKELKRRGFNVIVTSNGGLYEKELEQDGIKHYTVPLQNKNPFNVIKSIRLLADIIKKEKIDIVHSHARIPSFILGKLQKRMKFPFVTTAHWVFTTKYGLKYITDWGEKTVAVSEDIKTYLMDNYKIPESDIQVTINGIDTEKFSPDTDCTDIKSELGIKDGEFVISYVSRMDESRSLAAKQLIEAVPRLLKEIPNLKVIIVGGGDDFDNVKAMTARVNSAAGRDVIVLTGARTDINKLVAPCDLFVGVSRAALEAMAAEKPVVIAGNEGYIGLFDESRLQVGIDTNFCCRGCEQSSAELIYNDIIRFVRMSDDERKNLGVYGRELIKREYSVARMTSDTMKVYEWALSKNKEILVSGYYGFKNSGDDALLNAIIKDIKRYKESPNIVVLSANPEETARTYRVKSINRINIPSVMKHMKKAEMLISGGGTLIQDRTSTKSLWYYLAIISMAVKRGVKVMLYANGIGPLNKKLNAEHTASVLNRVQLITLRDDASRNILKEIGVTKPQIEITADPVFGLDETNNSGEKGSALLDGLGIKSGKILGVSVRRWANSGRGFEQSIADMCDYAADKYGMTPVFIPMQREKDEAVSRSIMSLMKTKSYIFDFDMSVEEIMSVFGELDMCIGMRLHSLIYSAAKSVPLIGLAYDPKIVSFMEYTHQKLYADVKNVSANELCELADRCMADYDNIKNDLKVRCKYLKEQAEVNAKLAVSLYESN